MQSLISNLQSLFPNRIPALLLALLGLLAAACQTLSTLPADGSPVQTLEIQRTDEPVRAPTPTLIFPAPAKTAPPNPDEPVAISGEIHYTSPFFLNTISEPFILLEDQAGFVRRDPEFNFSLEGQAIGPVEILEDNKLTYRLILPSVPQGTLLDVDNDQQEDTGVQIFAASYWSNTWGGPFLEDRDGGGWSTAYASTQTDPEQEDEIVGGTLIVWAPDNQQAFPTGFGPDGKLFSEDDPTAPIPAGYSLVDLDQDPFHIYKESNPQLTLLEGDLAVNDYSDMSYGEAFEAMFEKASREYPFTQDKGIDWKKLHDEFAPRAAKATNPEDFYRAVRDFTWAIPDAHVGVSFNSQVFYEEAGGSFGLVLTELSDGRVIVVQVLPELPGEKAGIQAGAEIIEWAGQPVSQAISKVTPYFGPYSTEHHKRLEQVVFLTRVPPDTRLQVSYKNPGESGDLQSQVKKAAMRAEVEYDSLFMAIPTFNRDEVAPAVEGWLLDSGLGYLRINTFSDDYRLMAQLWEHYIQGFIDNEVPGLVIDVRANTGGSGEMSLNFAEYFFNEEILLSHEYYYSDRLGEFTLSDHPGQLKPAPIYFKGPVALLISPYCVSACEGFANAMSQQDRSILIGHFPTAGAFGEVGRGQYNLPDDLSLQLPTGRPETPDGKLLIEGQGVKPDITVPVTEESALGNVDALLAKAEEVLSK